MTPIPSFVLDSFAILAYLQEEFGTEHVGNLLTKANRKTIKLYMHEINVGEVYYILYRRYGEEVADHLYAQIRSYPIEFITDLSAQFLLTTARLKGTYAISSADAFAVATAQFKNAQLISGDPELKPLIEDKVLQTSWPQK